MPLMPSIGAVHGLLLAALSWLSVTRMLAGSIERFCAVFLLVWCNLVCTALVLGAISKLDSKGLHFAVSVGLATLLQILLRNHKPCPSTITARPAEKPDRFDRIVRNVLLGALALAALGSVLICVFYVPNNWDSCTYRFSRAFFYLGQGSLLHVENPLDPRLLFYPFNGTFLYLFLAIYQFPAGSMYIVTGVAWVFAGLGTYWVARCIGASRTAGIVAAWICLLSPNILSLTAATNDEVLAAVPVLLALGFTLEWFSTGYRRHAVLAGIGIGLGFGTKLHWVFYAFLVAAGVIVFGVWVVRSAALRTTVIGRIPGLMMAAAVAAPLAGSFLVFSYISSGRLTNTHYNNAILNRPFRLSLAKEKIRINTTQLFVSPIPDLVPPVNHGKRREAYAAFNRFFMKCWFSDLVETTQRSPEGFVFEGPVDPEGAAPTEYTVWLGFMPHLLLAALIIGIATGRLPPAALWVAGAFFAWHVTYAINNRFYPTASVYYSFPAVLAFAAFGPAWDYARTSRHWSSRLLLAGFLMVFSTHILLGANLLAFGGLRNLQFLWRKTPAPEMHAATAGVVETIRAAERIYIPYTHWEVLYWNFMRFNPGARYATGVNLRLPTPDSTMLLSVAREGNGDLVPARLPASNKGLLYVGEADGEPVFVQGRAVETLRTGRRRYMLLPITWSTDPAGHINGLTMRTYRPNQTIDCCVGVTISDGIEYRYELQSISTGANRGSVWNIAGSADSGIPGRVDQSFDTLVIETRLRDRPDEIARTVRRPNVRSYNVRRDEDNPSVRLSGETR